MKGKIKYIFALIFLVVFFVIGIWCSNTKLTYLEYTNVNEKADSYIVLEENGKELRQEFIMPYGIIDSVSFQLGTFGRDNNSEWGFVLSNSSGKVLYKDTFNAIKFEDNGYYRHKLDKRIKVNKGEKYSFTITANDVTALSSLAFCVSNGNNNPNTLLTQNGEIVDSSLCFKIYGGDVDYWWHGLTLVIFLYFLIVLFRLYYDEKTNKAFREDKILMGLLLGGIVFLLRFTFANNGSFTDENDNLRGAMVIADGGVLYRDYVTQHTPVMYYLCSIFALLGADSIEQFRLPYYIFESIIWILLFFRHKDFFGQKKMYILPVLEAICISSLVSPQGYQVFSDGFEGLMFVVLLLEFIRYYKERTLKWDRSIIISLSIWGSFGSIFVSAYALFFLAMIVTVLEIEYLIKNKLNPKGIIVRYYRFLISLVIPPIAGIIYFKANHSLRLAVDQFYFFNRKVYPKYIGMGEKIIQPFVNGVQNFFEIISGNFNQIITASASNITILQLVLILLATGIVIFLICKKKYAISLALFLTMVFSATRGYGFHGLAAWYVIVLIISIFGDSLLEKTKKIGMPLLGIFAIILASTYFIAVGNNILYEQESVSELENRVVEMTANGENKDIYIDTYSCDSLYLYYKGCKPVNPATYMLPWYMDWYEKWDVDALLERKPQVVVYNEDRDTWGMTHYNNVFDNELKKNYFRLGDEGWKYSVWVKKDCIEWTVTEYPSLDNVQSLIYTIEDDKGGLAIVDGGYTTDAGALRTIIAAHGNHVSSWIITHPHPDHVGAFNEIMTNPGDIQVDEIYSVDVNLERYRETAQSYDGFESCEEFYRILGTIDESKIHFVHEGDTFEILGLSSKVLSAWDENVDALPDHLCNDGSMMFKLSGYEESMLFCADVQKEMEPFIIEKHSEDLNAEYVQAAHHGNWGLSTDFYDLLNPKMVLFDSTDYLLNPESNYDASALKEYFEGRGIEVVNYSNAPTTLVIH